MEHVARPYRQHPAQVIDAKPHEWVRSKGPDFNREAHRDGRDVQSIWILPDITVADSASSSTAIPLRRVQLNCKFSLSDDIARQPLILGNRCKSSGALSVPGEP